MKQRSQATGSVETSNSAYKFLSRADTIRRQAVAHRKIMSPTTISTVLPVPPVGGLFCDPTAGVNTGKKPKPGIVATRPGAHGAEWARARFS